MILVKYVSSDCPTSQPFPISLLLLRSPYSLRLSSIEIRAVNNPAVASECITQLYPALCDPWTVAHQAPLSMEFSRKEYWSGLPFLSPGDPPDPGIKPQPTALKADSLPSEPPGVQVKGRAAYLLLETKS